MKVVVTGGCGFIGSALVKAMINKGYQVLNVDLMTYAATSTSLDSLKSEPNYHFYQVDINDKSRISDIFYEYGPDGVIHLAAESHVDRSIVGPQVFLETNILGTYTMLDCAKTYAERRGKLDSFIFHHVSTDEVFGSLELNSQNMFTELTPYNPKSPYAASKAASDHLARAWHATYGLKTIVSNCSNNYGPYQFPEKLIPLIVTNALLGKDLPLYGNGENVRDWLHVHDHADALICIFENGKEGESYNVGANNELSNIEVVQKICLTLDELVPLNGKSYSDRITFVSDRPGHDKRYGIDATKIGRQLGWSPSISIDEGIRSTVEWYMNNQKWWKPLLVRRGGPKG